MDESAICALLVLGMLLLLPVFVVAGLVAGLALGYSVSVYP